MTTYQCKVVIVNQLVNSFLCCGSGTIQQSMNYRRVKKVYAVVERENRIGLPHNSRLL